MLILNDWCGVHSCTVPSPRCPLCKWRGHASFSTICVLQTQRLSESHGTHSEASHTAFSISALSSESRRSFENSPICFVSRVSLSLAAWPRWMWTVDTVTAAVLPPPTIRCHHYRLRHKLCHGLRIQHTGHWTKTLCSLIIIR